MTSETGKGNPYGYGLAALGAGLAGFSWYLLQSTPMTALGIGIAVVGSSIAITPTTPVPTKTVRRLLEGALLNIEAVLEDTGATRRAYYVPGNLKQAGKAAGMASSPAAAGGGSSSVSVPRPRPGPGNALVRAFVPLGSWDGGANERIPSSWDATGLVTTIEGTDYLVLHPPSAALAADLGSEGDLESLLNECLVEESGLVESVKAAEEGALVVVEFRNPRSRAGSGRVRRVLGSLEAGTAAALIALSRGRVARIASEEEQDGGRRKRVVVELL